ncbi:hypothetical protein GMLC_41820 [Geomonas limicola]|uniref:Peptidase S49 domain-containing protein n=2 Tax=Geomonas TaxID=2651583 RepID=A0A6V8MPQ8_9BACT|nr:MULTISPECIES: S49 family peptidase [Geomonas]GFO62010.1 hypothetical protein GMST_43350 [Geomonas silvestris]GFO70603.1 hypothetical protein GMLC_41820 [Geomonas limicola]
MNFNSVLRGPWMISPYLLDEILSAYSSFLDGDGFESNAVISHTGKQLFSGDKLYEVVNGTAIIPVHGLIIPRMNLFGRILGATSAEAIQLRFREALYDPRVEKILLHIDSPGGAAPGTFELAEFIFRSRGEKPTTAWTDGQMSSAAYLISSAAEKRFVSSEAANIGSIGVITRHRDLSAREANSGVKTSVLTAGRYKGTGHPHAPLSNADKEILQARLDHIYTALINTVARNLKLSAEKVATELADGREFLGSQGIMAGLADGMCTKDELCKQGNGGEYQKISASLVQRSRIAICKMLELRPRTVTSSLPVRQVASSPQVNPYVEAMVAFARSLGRA